MLHFSHNRLPSIISESISFVTFSFRSDLHSGYARTSFNLLFINFNPLNGVLLVRSGRKFLNSKPDYDNKFQCFCEAYFMFLVNYLHKTISRQKEVDPVDSKDKNDSTGSAPPNQPGRRSKRRQLHTRLKFVMFCGKTILPQL